MMDDISDSNAKRQIQTTYNVINELGVEETDLLLVLNKVDKVSDPEIINLEVQRYPEAIFISSKNGTGLDVLLNAIISCYESKLASFQISIKYKHAKLIPKIRKCAVIVQTDYADTFIRLDLRLPPGGKEKIQEFLKHVNQTEKS